MPSAADSRPLQTHERYEYAGTVRNVPTHHVISDSSMYTLKLKRTEV